MPDADNQNYGTSDQMYTGRVQSSNSQQPNYAGDSYLNRSSDTNNNEQRHKQEKAWNKEQKEIEKEWIKEEKQAEKDKNKKEGGGGLLGMLGLGNKSDDEDKKEDKDKSKWNDDNKKAHKHHEDKNKSAKQSGYSVYEPVEPSRERHLADSNRQSHARSGYADGASLDSSRGNLNASSNHGLQSGSTVRSNEYGGASNNQVDYGNARQTPQTGNEYGSNRVDNANSYGYNAKPQDDAYGNRGSSGSYNLRQGAGNANETGNSYPTNTARYN